MTPPSDSTYPAPATPALPSGRIFVFSGHMIDAPDRAQPRFPPEKEGVVRRRLAAQLEKWQVGHGDLAISGAARGGDILFAEICAERGAEIWLFLPMPEAEYLDESVRLPTGDWEARFRALSARAEVRRFFQGDHLGEDRDKLGVHARNNLWMVDAARTLATGPEDIYAVVVWDEKSTGDGPGGTSDFVRRIADAGGKVAPPINPLKLSAAD